MTGTDVRTPERVRAQTPWDAPCPRERPWPRGRSCHLSSVGPGGGPEPRVVRQPDPGSRQGPLAGTGETGGFRGGAVARYAGVRRRGGPAPFPIAGGRKADGDMLAPTRSRGNMQAAASEHQGHGTREGSLPVRHGDAPRASVQGADNASVPPDRATDARRRGER